MEEEQEEQVAEVIGLAADDVTPRGWLVALISATVLLALVAVLLGALVPY